MATLLDKRAAAGYGELVNAVYAMFLSDPHNLEPHTSSSFAPIWKQIAWIDMKDFILGFTDPRFYGVVLQATDANTTGFDYAIAIRGTEGALEWIDDALAVPVPFAPVPDSGRVAYGFNKIYSTLNVTHVATRERLQLAAGATRQTFGHQINALVEAEPSPRRIRSAADPTEPRGQFLVLGHSLGAALATLYVMENASLGTVQHINTICTYASPRVGWVRFVQKFNELASKNGITSWRIANVNDLVTHLPSELLGYRDVDAGSKFSGAGIAKNNPICMHNMRTYQHWLDPEHYSAPDGCALTHPVGALVETLAAGRLSIPDTAIKAKALDSDDAIGFTIDAEIPRSALP